MQQALKTYTILTVGDGLVTIIPSLLVSVAGGIVVTRAGSDFSLGADIGKQMFRTSRPLWIVSGVLLALAVIPGMPKIRFFALGRRYDVRGLEDEACQRHRASRWCQGCRRKSLEHPPSIPWMRC